MSGGYLNTLKYDIRLLDYSTRHFKIVEEIFFRGTKLFTIARQPHSKILPTDHHLVKFDNKFLYSNHSISFGLNHLSILGLKYKNISRLDLAIDFNTFKYGLKPRNFIDKFLQGIYVHNGRAKFKIIGKQDRVNSYQYLRFGNPISKCSVYLYNKTLELNEEVFKQHIFNKWEKSGLNVNEDVWRLEISLKSQNFDIINKSDGEYEKFEIGYCQDDNKLVLLFESAINKYFHFKHKSNQKNKDRWKDVKLFDVINSNMKIDFRNDKVDSNRSDKIFIKKWEHYNQEMRENNFELSTFMDEGLSKFVKSRKLEGYYERKVLNN